MGNAAENTVSGRTQLSEILASSREITIGGRKLQAQRTNLNDMADFEEHIKAKRVDDFLKCAAKANLDSELVKNTIVELFAHVFSDEEKMEMSRSLLGVRFFLLRAVSKLNTGVTEEEVCSLVTITNISEVITLLDQLNYPTGVENPLAVEEATQKPES